MKSFLTKNLVLAAICLSTTATMYSMDYDSSSEDETMNSRKCQRTARQERKDHKERCDPREYVDLTMTECGKIKYEKRDTVDSITIAMDLCGPKMLTVHTCLLPQSEEKNAEQKKITDAIKFIKTKFDTMCDFKRYAQQSFIEREHANEAEQHKKIITRKKVKKSRR